MTKIFNHIYILGGHKLAVSYFDKILAARTSGKIDYKKIFCIADVGQEFASTHVPTENIINKSYSDFIRDYLQRPLEQNQNDTLVPDHTAKHVMLQVFLRLAGDAGFQATLEPFHAEFKTPFLYKSENDAIWAMSYATWMCPPDCDEPATCPHTQGPRDWNFFTALPEFFKNLSDSDYAKYDFGCEILVGEIAHIPFPNIVSACRDFLARLKNHVPRHVLVATHSHCHGILGQFALKRR